MNISVATVGALASTHTDALEALRGEITVFRRCDELTEAIALAEVGRIDIIVLSEASPDLDATLIERLGQSNVKVIVMDDGSQTERARALNIATVSDVAEVDALVNVITAVHRGQLGGERARPGAESYARSSTGELPADEFDRNAITGDFSPSEKHDGDASPRRLGSPLSARHHIPQDGEQSEEGELRGDSPLGHGKVIAVWGPLGAPGTSTVAVNLAAELALEGEQVILIDANTYGASIAGMLGLLDESAGLAGACRQADQGLLTPQSLQSLVLNISILGARLQVLTGLALSSRWMEVRAAALEKVISCAAQCATTVVIDVGFALESSDELSWDSPVPRRNAATLRSLDRAEEIVAVGSADSVGVPRLINALGDLAENGYTASLKVVLNKVRAGAVGSHPERQLSAAWERYSPVSKITAFLPFDPTVLDKALLAGKTLAETGPESELRRGIRGLVISHPEAPRRRGVRKEKVKVKFSRNGDRLEGDGAQRGASSKHI
ncbi:AAA family ATPase [Haematomicrobium sanguinis]|uniref:AAA family ATPase n=1 Tax=Haematomicrobium sanguinis TaxID=479106 RepID=UPI00047B8EAA|nr:P-loop NTPase [Haematomicrobium sanguinis]